MSDTLALLDLFSGIGALSLGLERSGAFRTVAFCECDPFARRVLAKHWPEVPCYDDVRTLTAARLAADGVLVDAICGGFPCQDISVAGRGAGIAGERSGLWSEYARLIGELRPRYVIVENVAALLGRGLGEVLGDLAALGFDAEWHCIPASAVGAPHRRDRIWIIAHPDRDREHDLPVHAEMAGASEPVAHDAQRPWSRERAAIDGGSNGLRRSSLEDRGLRGDVADAASQGSPDRHGEPGRRSSAPRRVEPKRLGGEVADAGLARLPLAQPEGWHGRILSEADIRSAAERCDWWRAEPDVGRVAHGIAGRVDRLRSLGNSLVPQIPELIGRAILAAEASRP